MKLAIFKKNDFLSYGCRLHVHVPLLNRPLLMVIKWRVVILLPDCGPESPCAASDPNFSRGQGRLTAS